MGGGDGGFAVRACTVDIVGVGGNSAVCESVGVFMVVVDYIFGFVAGDGGVFVGEVSDCESFGIIDEFRADTEVCPYPRQRAENQVLNPRL